MPYNEFKSVVRIFKQSGVLCGMGSMVGDLIGNIVFGAIGFVAFVYGKKMALYRTMTIGLVLMIFPYFVSGNWALYGIGTALTAAMFLWKD